MPTYQKKQPHKHGERKGSVSLVQLGMWDRRTVDNRLVVSKHMASPHKRNTEIAQGSMKINDLLNTSPGCNKLRTIGSNLISGLLLGEPINRCAIHHV